AAVPSFVRIATWPYVDAVIACYATAALYCTLRATRVVEATADSRNLARWLVLAGVFSGLALSVKYTAVIIPGALVVVTLLNSPRRSGIRKSIYLTAVSGLVASPWYLRNLIFQGNPVYPFLFGGPFWDTFRAGWFGRF